MATAYCVKCRKMQEIKDPKEITTANGRLAVRGTCSLCGMTCQKFLPSKKE